MTRQLRYPRGAVASPHYLASAAGLAVLADGGNALDAAIATNLTLGVVAPYLCGYGGDVFAIVWDGSLHGYSGSGRSVAGASLEAARGRHGETMPVFGAETVTVPGAPAGWFALLDRFGTRSFGELARSALAYARDGFEVTAAGAVAFDESRRMYRGFADWEALYGQVEAGTVLRQPALARTIELLSDGGPDAYYRGPVADSIVAAVGAGGGHLSADDLAAHEGEWVRPLSARFRDVEVAELPPPTQGTTALEALRILDGFDLGAADPIEREHLRIEATKLAMADRDEWLTDPAHMRVAPDVLLADGWVGDRRGRVDVARAGTPDPGRPQPGGTAYLCAADVDGLRVSLIQSNFVHFGSGVHVPEWGINLNNRGFSFSLDPSRANALAPAKRPMHTLIPAMVLRDGKPCLVFGSMGGDAQVAVHVQVLGRVLDEDRDPADAIAAPRWRIDVGSWDVKLESRAPDQLLEGLRARGHAISTTTAYDSGMGHAHAIWDTVGGYGATSDPRAESAALGL